MSAMFSKMNQVRDLRKQAKEYKSAMGDDTYEGSADDGKLARAKGPREFFVWLRG